MNRIGTGDVLYIRRMLRHRTVPLFLILFGMLVAVLTVPSESRAFPLRTGEDCFYGEGTEAEVGIGTWMGYAVRFDPPYIPYTVDGISVYISEMGLALGVARRLKVFVLDEMGIRRQYTEIEWKELSGHQGWVLIDLADRAYNGSFTVIVSSGLGLNPAINVPVEAVFRLGVDTSEPTSHSMVYTSETPPPPPPTPPVGPFAEQRMVEQAAATARKLVPASTVVRGFPGGDWMIRAHAPGLRMETPHIIITQEILDAWIAEREGRTIPGWRLPRIEGLGPRGTVHCPINLAGVTLYYYEEERGDRFLAPHNGPWAHPDLIASLGALCRDLAAEGVIGLEHIGIYNDRNIHGTNTLSSHAYGLGIDITGFKYADGRVVLVRDHDDPGTRAILERIRDDYLDRYFTTVLDWTYQRHDNHFHVNLPYNP